jgi:CRP-like cAMP-binding protein
MDDRQFPQNKILAALPPAELERISRHLQSVQLTLGQVIYEPRIPIEHVYFVDRGMVSVLSVMENGDSIEVGTIGNRGLTGLTAALAGKDTVAFRHFIQVPGSAQRMSISALAAELDRDSALRQLMLQYQAAFLTQVMQGVACNGLHSVVQRCCKWLLMSQDVVGTDEVAITHEFIAQMLGVRRASVSDVLRPLQEDGLIRATRGKVTIIDREALSGIACECYRVIRSEYEQALSIRR